MAVLSAVSLALGVAELIGPKIVGWFAGDKGEEVAETVLDLAKSVAGADDEAEAIHRIKEDPQLAAQFQRQIMAHEGSLMRMAYDDRADARLMYRESETKTADEISKQVMSWNVWVVLALVVINALAVYFLKEEAAVLATVSNILGIVIKSLLDERKEVTGFYLGGSLDGREASSELRTKF